MTYFIKNREGMKLSIPPPIGGQNKIKGFGGGEAIQRSGEGIQREGTEKGKKREKRRGKEGRKEGKGREKGKKRRGKGEINQVVGS